MTSHLIQVLWNYITSHYAIYFFVHRDKSTNDRNISLKCFSIQNVPAAGSWDVDEPTEILTIFEILAVYSTPVSTISGRLYGKS